LDEIDDKIESLNSEIEGVGGEDYVEIKNTYEEIKLKYDQDTETLNKVRSMKEIGEKEMAE
jgi:hypothetical protein